MQMLLRNDKKKAITVMYQGRRILVHPNQTIEGPIQLSIFGLTPVESQHYTHIPATYSFEKTTEKGSSFNHNIDKTIQYINDYTNLPSVAICILSKDSFNLIMECVDSINVMVHYPKTKIYIFDTGTTESQTLNYYENIKTHSRIPVTIISVGEYHFSKNYNRGLKQVDADYYFIQNNDTVALNDYVSKLMKVALIEKIGACGPRMLYKDGTIQHDGQLLYDHHKKGFSGPTHVNLRRRVNEVSSGLMPADGITCAGMLINAKTYWEAGGLNESYHDIFQDVELNIKIRMNGKAIYCDRNALIHHYDNTSRNTYWANNTAKLKLKHMDYASLFGKFNNELRYQERKTSKFSIVTIVNDKDQYINFLNDVKKQKYDYDVEIIALPNFDNLYTSAAEALNIGLDVSESEYVILCHQDLRVPENWLETIHEHIKNIRIKLDDFGVLGVAGSWNDKRGDGGISYLNDSNTIQAKKVYPNFVEVQCLDEACLIVKKENSYRFDSQSFTGYHGYGSDLCLTYIVNGKKNFAINAPCDHLSDGIKNLSTHEGLQSYLQAMFTLFKKWRGQLPSFRNTTANFKAQENSIYFFIADELNKRNIPLKSKFILPD
jgi:GT2 family glycosyltransferase